MSRKKIKPILQPDEFTCGPITVKHALQVLGKKKSVKSLIKLCKTTNNGTSTKNIIRAFTSLGFFVLAIEHANLKHIQNILRNKPNQIRVGLVTYLYDTKENDLPHPESGHWAMVQSYSARNGRIILLDSYTAQKKSYPWESFRKHWKDYDTRRKLQPDGSMKKKNVWQHQLLLIVAQSQESLPKFSVTTQKIFKPSGY
jgi:ABC-type bacteriocin/lantibiotic exporter with double-glycine peptidase domain